jgi:hypothetical protein
MAQIILDLLKDVDVDHCAATTGVAIAHKVLEYQRTKLIYELRDS